MLTAILGIVGILVPIITKNPSVVAALGTTGTSLLSSLASPVTTLIQGLFSGQSKTQDFLAALAALSGVIAVLKSTPNMPADALTEINNVDLDVQAALIAYAKAGTLVRSRNNYTPITPWRSKSASESLCESAMRKLMNSSERSSSLNGEILAELRDIHRTLRGMEYISAQTFYEVQAIKRILSYKPFPTHLTLRRTDMPLSQPDPGMTLQYSLSLNPVGSSLGSVNPVWSSSDSANITITPDATGMNASVALGAGITVGESVTITATATDPTTGDLATGTDTFTVGAPPPAFPTSLTLTRTA